MQRQSYSPWDIVKVPFPFTEGIGEKRRPALIVSTASLSGKHRVYWLLMITSVVKPEWDGDVVIENFEKSGLPVKSVVRTAKIATLQEDKILGKIGSLGHSEREKTVKFLKKWIVK